MGGELLNWSGKISQEVVLEPVNCLKPVKK